MTVNALLIALVTIGTTISCVVLGVVGAYCAVAGILSAFNPSRTSNALSALVPHQSQMSGD
ncbi:MAG: hypothetical protein LAO56_04075 [Acidobacteriia bacterium]|nr:hypothetical protein [Terriglobia bacterium]